MVATTAAVSQFNNHFFGFTTHLETISQNPFIGISGAEAKTNTILTTNLIEIIDPYHPSQPVISMNYYNRFPQKLVLSFDSYTKYGTSHLDSPHCNDIEQYAYKIGTVPDFNDVCAETSVALNPPRPYILDEPLTISGLMLDPSRVYYLSFYSIARSTDTPGDLYSKQISIPFMTDFSPPHMPNYAIDVQVGDDGNGNINHMLNWEDFSDPESGIKQFYIEEKSNFMPGWNQKAGILVSDPFHPNINEKHFVFSNNDGSPRQPNMSYTYRVRAENQAGLFSDYIYSDPVTTVKTNKVLSNVSNYPNPFSSRKEKTTLFYYLNQDAGIEIKIYDSLGHFVRKYNYVSGIVGKTIQGACTLEWDGRNEQGEYVEKGGYFVVIEAPEAKGEDRKIVRMMGVIH